MRIGIIYDRVADYAHLEGPADRFAEFEPDSTIDAMKEAVQLAGHTPVDIGSPHNLLTRPDIDLAWNIAEGYGTRNREAWAPVLLEIHGIPFFGSDAAALSSSLDKHLTRLIARDCGLPVADGFTASGPDDFNLSALTDYPYLLKPRYEGTAKGIDFRSVVHNKQELETAVEGMVRDYEQDILIERLLPGAEYTCSVYGSPLRTLPVIQRSVDRNSRIGVHALSDDQGIPEEDQILPGSLDTQLEQTLSDWSLTLCREMKVRHFARIDFKMDENGRPHFLEINPLPTFAVDSHFAVFSEMDQIRYPKFLASMLDELIDDIFSPTGSLSDAPAKLTSSGK